jgi:hypothetical protein
MTKKKKNVTKAQLWDVVELFSRCTGLQLLVLEKELDREKKIRRCNNGN